MSRRNFIHRTGMVIGGCMLGAVPIPSIAQARSAKLQDFWVKDRWLSLRRTSTGEHFSVPFWVAGKVDWSNYVRLCYILRDLQDGNHTVQMDVELLNLLYGMQEWARLLGYKDPTINVNSGVRTPKHNASLEGAAHDSEHIYGRASDITMQGVKLSDLAAMATFYQAGGVGVYPGFLHVDVGPVRHWRKSPKAL